ncbi:hypothetical protein ACQEXU_10890 [Vibrio sp. TRT 21S02]|uniref:hypothetical protein n=1 Tax=Vibrio sp. TRT 21S02 TaxID=3418507 RepID=UPI003CE9BD9D
MNKLKLLLMSVALMSFNVVAEDKFGNWSFDQDFNAYTSTEIVHKKMTGMLKIGSDKTLKFGMFLPYDQCYVSEGYSEPLGKILVLGQYQDFRLQCIGESQAVVFANEINVSDAIIRSMVKDGNICLTIEENKFCFSGNGVKELKSFAAKS